MSSNAGEDQFLTLGEAAAVVGVSRATLRRRIGGGDLACYDDLTDRRRVLVAAGDLKRLTEPRPRPRIVPQVAA